MNIFSDVEFIAVQGSENDDSSPGRGREKSKLEEKEYLENRKSVFLCAIVGYATYYMYV